MGICWESSLASLPRKPPMSIGGIIIKIYCAVRYFGYGDDRCFARGGKVLYKLYEMAGAMIKKLLMSSASSAIGTGTVLGVHSALAPETPSIQGSDLRQATVDESKNLMKIDMSGASSFFMIALVITICLLLFITLPMCCCGCSPHKLRKKREEEKWKKEVRELMEQRNREDAELGLEAEDWQEVKKGTGPRLVDASGV